MDFRLAVMNDLPHIINVYKEIIKSMNENQIQIWDDVYPCSFFKEDIKAEKLYLLLNNDEVVAAFALCDTNAGEKSVEWKYKSETFLYLDRLGVNVNYSRKGIASLMLTKAKETAKKLEVQYLRLFVVDTNKPTIRLYIKNGFIKAKGIYNEVIADDLILHEYGYEIEL